MKQKAEAKKKLLAKRRWNRRNILYYHSDDADSVMESPPPSDDGSEEETTDRSAASSKARKKTSAGATPSKVGDSCAAGRDLCQMNGILTAGAFGIGNKVCKHTCKSCNRGLHGLCGEGENNEMICFLCVEKGKRKAPPSSSQVEEKAAASTTTKDSTTRTPLKRKQQQACTQKKPKKTKTLSQCYKPTLVQLMNCKDSAATNPYTKETQFSESTLLSISPEDIVRFFKLKAFGSVDADEINEDSLSGRHSSLMFYKKAISFFMPDRLIGWSVRSKEGNPTKSTAVNDLLNLIRKKEVRGQGKESQARGPFVEAEYEQAISMFESIDDVEQRLFTASIFRYQYTMGGRIDDCSKFQSSNLQKNSDPDHENVSLITKLPWSKNVMTEKQAPWQILLGAAHPKYCALVGLSSWIEWMLGQRFDTDSRFVFALNGSDDPAEIKRQASTMMKSVRDDPTFDIVLDDKKGTHSMRKFATDRARKNGQKKDDIDHRFRWKQKKSQQDSYTSTTIPIPDALVAAALCKDGPIHYHLKEYCGVDSTWICDYVTPLTFKKYGRGVASVLGRALLWQIFDPEQSKVIPSAMRQRIKAAFASVPWNRLKDGENPVAKLPLIVTGDLNGALHITVLNEDFKEEKEGSELTEEEKTERLRRKYKDENIARFSRSRASDKEEIQRLSQMISTQTRQIQEYEATASRRTDVLEHQNQRMITLLNQILRQPYRVLGQRSNSRTISNHNECTEATRTAANNIAEEAQTIERSRARLEKNICCLHQLWVEYEFGIGSNKPAKEFTSEERGRCRFVYSLRKVFWEKVSEMVGAGWNYTEACNAIKNHYGAGLCSTKILQAMRRDRRKKQYPRKFEYALP